MLTRSEAIRRIQLGLSQWTQLEPEGMRFVLDEVLEHLDAEVVTAAENVVPLKEDEDWADLLHPARPWLNATLHFDTERRPIVSLRAGPRRQADEVDPQAEVPIAVSMEPRPLRLLK